MQTPDGRTVRPGKLIRCGHLANLTDRDRSALTGKISVIADFRSMEDFLVYADHPEHVEVKKYIAAHRSGSVTMDYEI